MASGPHRSKHEIAWIDKKVKMLSDHKAKQSARLAVVTEQLTKWKAFPPEDDTSAEALVSTIRPQDPVTNRLLLSVRTLSVAV